MESARARGLTSSELLTKHSFKHASLQMVTLTGMVLGNLLGGAIIVEQLFGRPGLGRVMLDAITHRDLPVVMTLVIFSAIVFVIVNLIVDALYPVLDPRLRRTA